MVNGCKFSVQPNPKLNLRTLFWGSVFKNLKTSICHVYADVTHFLHTRYAYPTKPMSPPTPLPLSLSQLAVIFHASLGCFLSKLFHKLRGGCCRASSTDGDALSDQRAADRTCSVRFACILVIWFAKLHSRCFDWGQAPSMYRRDVIRIAHISVKKKRGSILR